MKAKTYNLVTIEDILKVVNKDNLDNFIIDFKYYLDWRINFNDTDILKDIIKFKDYNFRWIDDGKHNAKITIEVPTPPINK